MWYSENKKELENFIKNCFNQKLDLKGVSKQINGLIVPHAGYSYSGNVAGKAYSIIKNSKEKAKKAVILGPSHYIYLNEAVTYNQNSWPTPLGEIKTFNSGFRVLNIKNEHSIDNQVPFLQMLGLKEILPLMIGDITFDYAKETAKKISMIKNAVYIISSDLSHFLKYEDALEIDKKTIEIIENINKKEFRKIDACGIFPILILFELCNILNTKPKLLEYKNSGDVTGEKSQVVGYASFYF
jgi:AmmeMemoRadiSam system protein B